MVFLCLIFYFFVQDHDKVYGVDYTSNIKIEGSRGSCKLVTHNLSLDFLFAYNVFEILIWSFILSFIDFISKTLPNSLELLF